MTPTSTWSPWSKWFVISCSLTTQVSTIEFTLVEHNVLYGLKQGNAVLLTLNKKMSLKAVEQIMDDTQEGLAYQKV